MNEERGQRETCNGTERGAIRAVWHVRWYTRESAAINFCSRDGHGSTKRAGTCCHWTLGMGSKTSRNTALGSDPDWCVGGSSLPPFLFDVEHARRFKQDPRQHPKHASNNQQRFAFSSQRGYRPQEISRAASATDSAEILLARATARRIPAKQDDFLELVADLNILSASARPELSQTVNDTRIVLANYKSALAPVPNMPGTQAKVEKSIDITAEAATVDSSKLPGSVLIAVPGATFEFFATPFFRRLDNAPYVSGVGLMFGSQHLDGWRWNDVAFVNTLIRYDGGELVLNNVRFIQCTFQLAASNPRSAKVATYVALAQPYLKIGPND